MCEKETRNTEDEDEDVKNDDAETYVEEKTKDRAFWGQV